MKNNYEKYMQEVWDMKERVYNDFKKSGYAKYSDFLNNELKDMRIKHRETKNRNPKEYTR